MKSKVIFGLIIASVALSCGAQKKVASNGNEKYNIILLLADDLGRNDIAPYGNKFIEMPNLTAMAATGIQCVNGYAAAPLCSPTRASIITGTNPARINLTEHLHGYAPPGPNQKLVTPKIETGLPPQLTTIPEALNPAGYVTAHIGKWHLGMGPSSPKNQGFDLVYGGGAEGLPNSFFYPFFNGKPYPKLLEDSKEGDFLDDVLTTRAIRFLTNNKDSSFFMELNFYAPHVPIQGKPALVEKYNKKRANSTALPNAEYAAMVESIDANVGRIIQTVKDLKLDKKTVIIFTSDNGGLSVEEVPAFAKHTPPTDNGALKDGKGYIADGGIKTPWIFWAPGIIEKPNVAQQLITTDDVFNTCMALAGVATKSPDGQSLLPLLKNGTLATKPYFLHFPHYSPQRGKPGAVMIEGKFKLVEWYETGELELYDLSKDEGEENNIAKANAATVQQMKISLDAWRKSVDAKMCTPNPIYTGGK